MYNLIESMMKKFFEHILVGLALVLFVSSCYNEDNRIFPTCDDGILNNGEEEIDCGGENCMECPPTCFNGVLDWNDEYQWYEHGIDCGGPCESVSDCGTNGRKDVNPFADALHSENCIDCVLEVYPFGHAEADQPILCGDFPGSCNDDVPICDLCANCHHDPANGEFIVSGGVDVAVIDCGGSECPDCEDLCSDGVLNGGEGPCPDCGSGCPGGACDLNYCNDGLLTYWGPNDARNETGIDCGGCGCPECDELCDDGLLNGLEEAIDCGTQSGCVDCLDPILCGDGVQNGYETGIDCYDDNTPGNMSDDLSPCGPCQALCNNTIFDGNELDTDCGDPDQQCQPCGSDGETGSWFTYEVDGVLYESQEGSIGAAMTDGVNNAPDPNDPAWIFIAAGSAHNFSFTLYDSELNTIDNMLPQSWTLDNTNLAATGVSKAEFVDHDMPATTYVTAGPVGSSQGIEVDITELQYTGMFPNDRVVGTFSGVMSDGNGGTITITNGEFQVHFN